MNPMMVLTIQGCWLCKTTVRMFYYISTIPNNKGENRKSTFSLFLAMSRTEEVSLSFFLDYGQLPFFYRWNR